MAAELVSGLEYMHAQSVIHPSGIISHPSLGIFSFTPFRFYFRCALWPPNSFLVSNTCTRSRSSAPPVSSLIPPSVSSHSHGSLLYFRSVSWPPNSSLDSNTCTRSRLSTPPISFPIPPHLYRSLAKPDRAATHTPHTPKAHTSAP